MKQQEDKDIRKDVLNDKIYRGRKSHVYVAKIAWKDFKKALKKEGGCKCRQKKFRGIHIENI